ncbi:uncharacterized protein N0V89_000495 [Didymosphaeria variabile]|uniref:Probable Xaa-Pro aminopeptidase P n=1 Tax=Didymosphaeria variabile TaxID=1932322 RepID=A0A9W8XVF4_9PLEO|nr:uncharacterized protein N0V89_000495 [Didymosphaeria variabile]KAJ4359936.1 hypothetical protein N0V89_000495 [Didymosphaeria variabile]
MGHYFDWNAERKSVGLDELINRAPQNDNIDHKALRAYRQSRIRTEMAKHGMDAVVLCDGVNIRYATGTRNMQVWSGRNAPARYLLLTQERSILFEFAGCAHLVIGFEDTIDEVRIARGAQFNLDRNIEKKERDWAKEMGDLIKELLGRDSGVTVGLERMNAGVGITMTELGFKIVDAQVAVELAKSIKCSEKIQCIKESLRATERGVAMLRDAIKPGQTEAELWSILHKAVIERDGDYVETRLLNAGKRSVPWFQETSNAVIEENTLICLDTDVVGCHGYYSDFSRTFHAGPGEPSASQKQLYKDAYEMLNYNISVLRPNMTFKEFADAAWVIPQKYWKHRYFAIAHGVGMTCEFPYLYSARDFDEFGYDGIIEPGMTLSIEAYLSEERGTDGVKLEDQVLITETGIERLSQFPFEKALLS